MAPVLLRAPSGTKEDLVEIDDEIIQYDDVTSSRSSVSERYKQGETLEEQSTLFTGELLVPLRKSLVMVTDVVSPESETSEEEGRSWYYTGLSGEARGDAPFALREFELAWIASHQEELSKFKGQWVAVDRQGIVASGFDFSEVVKDARLQGIEVPYVVRVETEEERPFVGRT